MAKEPTFSLAGKSAARPQRDRRANQIIISVSTSVVFQNNITPFFCIEK